MRTKLLIFCLFCVCSTACVYSQNEVIDSLRIKLEKSGEPAIQWGILKDITEYYISNNPDSALLYATQCLDLAQEQLPDKISLSYVLLGAYYTEYQAYEEASEVLFKALELSEQTGCLECRIEALNELFIISYDQLKFDKSLTFLKENLQTAILLRDTNLIAKSMTNLSLVYSQVPQNDSAQHYANLGIQISLASKEYKYLKYCYNNLGIVHENKKEYAQAIGSFKKVAEYAARDNNKEMAATALFNVASSCILSNQLDTGFVYLELARQSFEELKRVDLMAYYYEAMSEYYSKAGNHEQALDFFIKSTTLRDSIQNAVYSEELADAEARFETTKKEAQIAEQDLLIERQRNVLIGSLSIILLLLGLFQYFRYQQKIKNQRSELALQLKQTEAKKLKELDQLKSSFFANISHEFRTPLTLIKTPLQDLLNGSVRENLQKYYRIMDRNADRLLKLVNQLLDLAKLESGKMELQAVQLDVGELIRSVAFSFEGMAINKEIDFRVNVTKDKMQAWVDSEKIKVILINLLSNAFKFTKEEGMVAISSESANNRLVIKVEDTGIGIAAEQLDHIFTRFYHAPASSDQEVNSGIGLALTKELVELHKGYIEVESEEGVGTTFILTIPLGETHLEHLEKVQVESDNTKVRILPVIPTPQVLRSPESGEVPLKDPNQPIVLLVEDNPDVRTYLHDILQRNYHVLEAANGQEGLQLAYEHIPDLIITDIMMPIMDGNEFCKLLKIDKRTSHVPVIMLTAKADRTDKLEGLQTGADDFLIKPFDPEELKIRMVNLIEQRRFLRAKFEQSAPFQLKEIAITSVDESFLKNLLQIIESNIDDEVFSIEQLANAAAMSRSQLHRKIKALTGISPSVFMRTIRLGRAKELLERQAGNASEVAYMVGFNSATYFAKCFKDQFGYSPKEVRSIG